MGGKLLQKAARPHAPIIGHQPTDLPTSYPGRPRDPSAYGVGHPVQGAGPPPRTPFGGYALDRGPAHPVPRTRPRPPPGKCRPEGNLYASVLPRSTA
uniref:Uncharacterized protein n=1 Tax=Thermus sp. TK10 TaxID=243269 RepID=Q68YB8_9DEIN|nr:hypothetical protein [Thermus sp. TK10]